MIDFPDRPQGVSVCTIIVPGSTVCARVTDFPGDTQKYVSDPQSAPLVGLASAHEVGQGGVLCRGDRKAAGIPEI